MTPEQLQQFRDRLFSGRQPVKYSKTYAHPRGWNDALDFVERMLKEILGEKADAKRT